MCRAHGMRESQKCFSSFCVSSSVVEDIPHDGWKFFGIISTFVAILGAVGEAGLCMHILAYRKHCLAILRSEKRNQMLFGISAPRGSISWSWAHDFFAKSAASQVVTSTQHVGAKWKQLSVFFDLQKLCREMLSRFLMQFVSSSARSIISPCFPRIPFEGISSFISIRHKRGTESRPTKRSREYTLNKNNLILFFLSPSRWCIAVNYLKSSSLRCFSLSA